MPMTDHDKALEAAARAFAGNYFGEDAGLNQPTLDAIREASQAAITAFLAQREADGYIMTRAT